MRLPRPLVATLVVVAACGGGVIASVTVQPAMSHVPVGGHVKLTAQAFTAGKGSVNATFTWSSDRPAIATVDGNGNVHGVADGAATIAAVAPNGVKGTATVVVGTGGNILTIATTGTGQGSITSSPAGIDCGMSCAAGFPPGSMVTLTAKAAAGSYFRGWSGACSGTSSCTVTMDSDLDATAEFDLGAGPTLTVAMMGSGTGTVTSTPAGLSCTSGATTGCSGVFASGTQVTLAASVASGVFVGWSGGGCAGNGSCVITLTADTQVTATVAKTRTLAVTLAGDGSGTVTSTPAGISCTSGSATGCSFDFPDTITMVSLSEAPAATSSWAGWSVPGGGAPCTAAATSCPFTPGATAVAAFSSWRVAHPFPSQLAGAATLNGRIFAGGADGRIVVTGTPGFQSVAIPSAAVMHGVAASATRAVLVGDGGALVLSGANDPTTWSAVSSGTTANLRAVASSTTSFVAVGDGGVVVRSADGTSWSTSQAGSADLFAVAESASGIFAAAGAGGALYTSADGGATWTARSSGTTQTLRGLGYAPDPMTFIAVGNAGTEVTSDAAFTTWTAAPVAAATGQDLYGVAAVGATGGGTAHYAIGGHLADGMGHPLLLSSLTGAAASWTAIVAAAARETFIGVYYGPFFHATGDAGSLLVSSDGTSWGYDLPPGGRSASVANTSIEGLASDGTIVIGSGSNGALYRSTDGTNWSCLHAYGPDSDNAAVAFGSGNFVSVGSKGTAARILVASSPNGDNWADVAAALPATGSFTAVTFNNGFTAVGYQAPGGTLGPLVATSSNGAANNWVVQATTVLAGVVNSVASSGTTTVVTSGANIFTTTNGKDFVQPNITAAGMGDMLGAVAFGNGTFVVLDLTHPEVTLTSPDGATWTRRTATAALHDKAVSNGFVFGNGVFLTNTLAQSADGISWTRTVFPVEGSVKGAVYVGGKGWIAGGAFETLMMHP